MDLNAPLGMMPPSKRKHGLGLAVGIGAVLVAVGASAIVIAVSDPRDGEPSAVAAIPPPTPKAQAGGDLALAGMGSIQPSFGSGPVDRTPTASFRHDGRDGVPGRNADEATIENGVKVFRAMPTGPATVSSSATDARGPLIIDVSRVLDDPHQGSRVVIPAHGDALAARAPDAAGPKIAIFVSGMGMNETATRTAIEVMPSAVTLAFLPTGGGVTASVEAAKARGHEILLQLPMQNTPSDRVAHMLEPSESEAAVQTDLKWMMGRFAGYDGVVNLLGAPVSADQTVMNAVMKAVRDHHLFYLDDGTSRGSVAVTVASGLGVPALKADMVLDATTDASVVRANLDALAAIARRKGSAIGMASGLPDHLAAIAGFAGGLQAQGITLVPVSALADAATSTTTTR